MSDVEVARGRHSETKQLLTVTASTSGQLTARPTDDDVTTTYAGPLPPSAQHPTLVGRWRHFKGGEYEVLGLVDGPPNGPLVLYRDGHGEVWLRPASMIDDMVVHDGTPQRRFVRTVSPKR